MLYHREEKYLILMQDSIPIVPATIRRMLEQKIKSAVMAIMNISLHHREDI